MGGIEIKSVIKLRLKVTKEASRILDGQSQKCNWLYNRLLGLAQELRKRYFESGDKAAAETIYSDYGMRNLVPEIKEEKPFLKTVHSSPTKNVALRVTAAIKAHRTSKNQKKRVGWPNFRKWKRKWFSLFYDEPNKGFKMSGSTLKLSLGMGNNRDQRSVEVEIEEAAILKNKSIRNLRIVKEFNTFYAVFTIATTVPEPKTIKNAVAIDPNHKNLGIAFATTGQSIELVSPHFLKPFDTRIDELKTKRDRCNKKSQKKDVLDDEGNVVNHYYQPSRRWDRYNEALNKVYQKRRDQTKVLLYTFANRVASEFDYIGIGNYAPQGGGITTGMRRAMNNRSLIGRFKEIMAQVALKSGKTFIIYDETGTTRTCHACNYVVEGGIAPSIRQWECGRCHTIHDRDENAAINGLRRILRDLQTKKDGLQSPSVPSSGLVQATERWAWRALPSGLETTLRGYSGGLVPQRQEIQLEA